GRCERRRFGGGRDQRHGHRAELGHRRGRLKRHERRRHPGWHLQCQREGLADRPGDRRWADSRERQRHHPGPFDHRRGRLLAQHGLLTGDTVTYSANGNTPLGGLTDGRTYGVIYVTDQSLELGAAFSIPTTPPAPGTPPTVDIDRDTIHFKGAHNLRENDAVI